jgi:hypothetical protein
MWLFIDTDQNTATGWEGYDFIIGRLRESSGEPWIEKNTGGWQWKKVARVEFRVEGNELHLAVPRSALGLGGRSTAVKLDFKWADNLQRPGDLMDFYTSGDVAPEGRFNYRYE